MSVDSRTAGLGATVERSAATAARQSAGIVRANEQHTRGPDRDRVVCAIKPHAHEAGRIARAIKERARTTGHRRQPPASCTSADGMPTALAAPGIVPHVHGAGRGGNPPIDLPAIGQSVRDRYRCTRHLAVRPLASTDRRWKPIIRGRPLLIRQPIGDGRSPDIHGWTLAIRQRPRSSSDHNADHR
ncbi:MAG TPA: hypothetical protein VGD71_36755 [Kribbella sp.]|jgi:hypothetical protein